MKSSFIQIFVNGESSGQAFQNILEGKYYPSVSLYSKSNDGQDKVKVSMNFGRSSDSYWWENYRDHGFKTVIQPYRAVQDQNIDAGPIHNSHKT